MTRAKRWALIFWRSAIASLGRGLGYAIALALFLVWYAKHFPG